MKAQEKILFTVAFIAAGWIMLLWMPRLPNENPASGADIFIYAVVNFYAMFRVSRWFREIN
jgi:hypothetical protein